MNNLWATQKYTNKLSTEHDVLLDEETFFAPMKGPASDLLALIANSWVRVESGLLLPTFGRLDVGGRLREGRVVLQSHLLQFLQSDGFPFGSRPLRP